MRNRGTSAPRLRCRKPRGLVSVDEFDSPPSGPAEREGGDERQRDAQPKRGNEIIRSDQTMVGLTGQDFGCDKAHRKEKKRRRQHRPARGAGDREEMHERVINEVVAEIEDRKRHNDEDRNNPGDSLCHSKLV